MKSFKSHLGVTLFELIQQPLDQTHNNLPTGLCEQLNKYMFITVAKLVLSSKFYSYSGFLALAAQAGY